MQCGLCCDGTLFDNAPLQSQEKDLAVSLGLELLESHSGEPRFAQPCPQFVDGCCAAYEHNPVGCTEYRCHLLDDYTAGKLELADALEVIGAVRGAIRRLEDAMQAPAGAFSSHVLYEFFRQLRPQDRPDEMAAFLLACNRYLALANGYFHVETADVDDVVELIAEDEQARAARASS
jgi:hypothetical protein